MALFQIKTGSEWHTTERRGASVLVDGEMIFRALKSRSQNWEMVGSKGKHGKWCIAEYEIPIGSKVTFRATANDRDPIEVNFVVGVAEKIDVEGYPYGGDICGWIVEIGADK